jgi:ComF family protein
MGKTMWKTQIKKFLLDLFFPRFCFGCQREGSYLCQDCQATLEISGFHQTISRGQNLRDLYFAVDYRKPLIKKLIQRFKYDPFIKELTRPLASLIIEHFLLMENKPDFREFGLVPIPLEKKKLKWRGFNQAEEIAGELAKFFNLRVLNNVLVKRKKTLPQVELSEKERRENVKGAFLVKNKELVVNKKILLVDDVYTTGSTMEEAARVLKEAGAKEVVGIVIARAVPGADKFQNV